MLLNSHVDEEAIDNAVKDSSQKLHKATRIPKHATSPSKLSFEFVSHTRLPLKTVKSGGHSWVVREKAEVMSHSGWPKSEKDGSYFSEVGRVMQCCVDTQPEGV